ncbi:MAG TPA: hypothetical protein VET87_21345 [Rubrivivax sp.]|nr:hypothetical protein [Rubrivivax sp.]
MERVVKIVLMRRPAGADLGFWLSRPMAERIAAVEALRTQAPNEPKPLDAEPRLQRICRVAQRTQR